VFRHCHHKNLLLYHVLSQFHFTSWRVYYFRQMAHKFLTWSFSWNLFTFSPISHPFLFNHHRYWLFSHFSYKSIIILTYMTCSWTDAFIWESFVFPFACHFWTWGLLLLDVNPSLTLPGKNIDWRYLRTVQRRIFRPVREEATGGWDVTLCPLVSSFQRSEESLCLHLYPQRQRRIPEDLNVQQLRCKNP